MNNDSESTSRTHAKAARFLNLRQILDQVRASKRISQARISERCGLQPSTVSNHVKTLRTIGILVPDGKGETTLEGGRPSDLLCINSTLAYFGVALVRPRELVFHLCDLQGTIVARQTQAIVLSNEPTLARIIAPLILDYSRSYPAYRGTTVLFATKEVLEPEATLVTLEQPDAPLCIASAAEGAGYYTQIMDTLRGEDITSVQIARNPFSIQYAWMPQGIGHRGAHGLAGRFMTAEAPTPYPFAGSAFAVQQTMQKTLSVVLGAAGLTDPSVLVVTGDLLELDAPVIQPWLAQLNERIQPTRLITRPERDASVIGAAWMVADKWLHQFG